MQLQDKIVYVGPFLKRTDRGGDRESKFTNVYVKNLAEDVDDEGLKKISEEFGEVLSTVIMRVSTRTQLSNGWMEVCRTFTHLKQQREQLQPLGRGMRSFLGRQDVQSYSKLIRVNAICSHCAPIRGNIMLLCMYNMCLGPGTISHFW